MSSGTEFKLSRQPKGKPAFKYEGPSTIAPAGGLYSSRSGPQLFKLRSDKLFHGQDGCYETCTLVSAGENGRSIQFSSFIRQGSLEGVFDPSGGDLSLWAFELDFMTSQAFTMDERNPYPATGESKLSKIVRLGFYHECVEFIPEAPPHGRELSPCEAALVEEKRFKYQVSTFVDVEFVFHIRA